MAIAIFLLIFAILYAVTVKLTFLFIRRKTGINKPGGEEISYSVAKMRSLFTTHQRRQYQLATTDNRRWEYLQGAIDSTAVFDRMSGTKTLPFEIPDITIAADEKKTLYLAVDNQK